MNVPVVHTERNRGHDPDGEIWIGIRTPGTEVAERAGAIVDALREVGAPLHDIVEHGDGPLRAVHTDGLLGFLATAWDRWVEAGLPDDPGQGRVVPYVFALPALTSGRPAPEPVATWARTGRYCFDTMTLIGPGTWDAARAAVDAALTAADLVLGGERVAYAACRPPGHHVAADCYGGSCYLNNAAVAAQHLIERGVERVAVIDIDAHHGNGTQEIFYERGDVWFGSVHVDPAAGWFPHFLGFAHERGAGRGAGRNRNVPLGPGSGDREWLAGLDQLVAEAASFEPSALVVSLGVDAATADPESPLTVTADGHGRAGALLAGLGVPTTFVQEGGYDLASLGSLVVATLAGFEEAAAHA